MRRVLTGLFLSFFIMGQIQAAHVCKLSLSQLEWNGSVRVYKTTKDFSFTFTKGSMPVFVDSFSGKKIYAKVNYQPVYSDLGTSAGFTFTLFDSISKQFTLITRTRYEKGFFDAGYKENDEWGTRQWIGKLRYTPDTAVKIPPMGWSNDNFTFTIRECKVWLTPRNGKPSYGKLQHRLYFDGKTGKQTKPKKVGKVGKDKIYLILTPIKYVWGADRWIDIKVSIYRENDQGKKEILLEHLFAGKDKDIQYKYGRDPRNVYEVRDSNDEWYLLMIDVMLLPY